VHQVVREGRMRHQRREEGAEAGTPLEPQHPMSTRAAKAREATSSASSHDAAEQHAPETRYHPRRWAVATTNQVAGHCGGAEDGGGGEGGHDERCHATCAE